ncbi:ATP-binding protein [Nonomuraea basaltis]|uniref:ATP-binding protein n=1 Tax=Nonomuraea basaltis TaxID=2495887 RepID=UPI003B847D79
MYGRSPEQEQLRHLLTRAQAGDSAALVISGEAGIGKTALLEHLAAEAGPARILRTTGIEAETELPFAALHQLLRPALGQLELLPEPQAAALRAAFGMAHVAGQDRFLIGLAVLTLLSEHAGEGPVLCLVDDAQWVDQASMEALGFAARRLDAEGVVMLFAMREPRPLGLPELRLDRLDEEAARAVVGSVLPEPLMARVMEEAHGNPLALIELSRAMSEEQQAPGGATPSSRVQATFGAQIQRLPEPTRRALLVAAAHDSGELSVVLAASGVSPTDLEPAEKAGLVRLEGATLAFRHPLVRAAAYHGATYAERIAAHRALAEILHGEDHADRRAWHRAAAATGPDEQIARELERAADRATGLLGTASASAAYERASQLSADPEARQRRLVAAAQLAADAGQFPRVAALLERSPDSPDLARVRAALELNTGSARRAVEVLLTLDLTDPAVAADALHAAQSAADPDLLARVPAPPPKTGQEASVSERFAAAHAMHLRADHRAALDLAILLLRHCRDHGLMGWKATCMHLIAEAHLALGELGRAGQAAEEGLRITEYAGLAHRACHLRATLAALAALEGDQDRCHWLAEAALSHATAHDIGSAAARARHALALLHLGSGEPEPALDQLDQVPPGPLTAYLLPDLVEAAARTGTAHHEAATRCESWARQAGRPDALALATRCRALISPAAEAEAHFETALRQHSQEWERSRTHLLYGEWLRRRRRRTDARRQLRAALEGFEQAGAIPWADRARAELRGTGEVIDQASATGTLLGRLTPQEREVVRLAAAGISNREIATQLFLSPRTVGHHLYRAFPKLGVTSRTQLADILR